MTRHNTGYVTLALFAATAGSSIAAPFGALAQDVRVAHAFVQGSVQGGSGQSFADKVSEETGLNVEISWSGALGGGQEIVELVGGGAVPMGVTVPAYTPAALPVDGIGTAPMLYFDTPQGALDATRAVIDDDPAATAELERANVEVLVVHTTAPYHLVCSKPVENMADLQGLKVRTYSALASKVVSTIGIVPVNMVSAETYEGLQRGTVDCAMYSHEFAVATRLYEVAPYWSTLSFGAFSGAQLYANRDFMASLNDKTAETIRQIGREIEKAEIDLNMTADRESLEIAQKNGVTLVEFKELDAFRAAMPDALDVWIEDVVDGGLALEDAERIAGTVRDVAGEN